MSARSKTVDISQEPVVALGFRNRSGKDTIARELARRFSLVHLSFAQPLYDIIDHLHGDISHLRTGSLKDAQTSITTAPPGLYTFTSKKIPDPLTLREALIAYGDLLREFLGEDILFDSVLRRAAALYAQYDLRPRGIVISDLRTTRELTNIRSYFACSLLLSLDRPSLVRDERLTGQEFGELRVADFDYHFELPESDSLLSTREAHLIYNTVERFLLGAAYDS